MWADAYEALIAALYLDGGFEAAHRFVRNEFARDLEGTAPAERDHKSALQELLQGRGQPVPDYVVAAEEGPSHRRRFRVQCVLEGRVVSEGEGHSKKEAQQDAARKALAALGGGCRRHLGAVTRSGARLPGPGRGSARRREGSG